jgi:hypothetical protein
MPAYGGNLGGGAIIQPVMGRPIAVLLAAAVMTGCAQRAEPRSEEIELAEVTADPETYDGERITVRAGYYGSFEVSVLTTGFAESHPPRPVDPVVWVAAAPPAGCTDEAPGVAWAEDVTATGRFRYDPDGGFGHLGAYDMALEDARLTCA